MKNVLFKLTMVICMIMLFTSCADTVSVSECVSVEPVGFWYGLWHGMIAPISVIVSWFDPDVAMYAVYNNGGFYDAGFALGAGILGFGASSAS